MNTAEMTVKERIARLRRGEVLPGYKKTEVGVVPEGWESTRVRAIASSARNSTVGGPFGSDLVSNDYVNQGVPVIRGQNMGEVWLSGNFVYVTSEKAGSLKANLAHPEDIVFTQRGTLGQVSIVPEKPYDRYLISQSQMKLTLNRCIADPIFFYYVFVSRKQQDYIRQSTIQTGVPHINLGILRDIPVQLPPLPEQRRIAEILSAWDEALEKFDLLIEKKRELKRGLMQVLLSGKRRFPEFDSGRFNETEMGVVPEEWDILELKDLVSQVVREVPKPDKSYWALSIRSHGKGTFHRFVEKPDEVCMESLFLVRPNDLIVNITFAWEHAIAIAKQEDEGKLVSHRFPTYVINEELLELGFLGAIILQPSFRKKLELISPGGAGRNRVLNKKSFMKIKLPLPPLPEQRRIADCLSALDREIELLEREKAQRQTQKKALMELLLTGKVRVDVTDKEKNDGQE